MKRNISTNIVYRHYSIRFVVYRSSDGRFSDEGYDAFVGFTPVFRQAFPTVNRCKIAIDLWLNFHRNPLKFWRISNHLFITNRYNYSGCYGKLKLIKDLKKLSRIGAKEAIRNANRSITKAARHALKKQIQQELDDMD